VSSKEGVFLQKMPKNYLSFAALMHLADGLWLDALLRLKAENSRIYLVGKRILRVPMMEQKLILPWKITTTTTISTCFRHRNIKECHRNKTNK
jgi:hypothetical protein